ncbi:MAG: MoaD/ThiS family protein [Candidatus Binatia bacterium]|nr:MoaD/ThiS family protein [Candidatus Binatia bacterium]
MRVSVKLLGAFRRLLPHDSSPARIHLELDEQATLLDLIERLGEEWGKQFKEGILSEGPDGRTRVRPFARVIVNGKTLGFSPADQIVLPQKDGEASIEVLILQAIQGGTS